MDTTGPRTAESLAARFHDVDSSGVPEDFIAYLRKMEESESGRAVREATYRALGMHEQAYRVYERAFDAAAAP